jgi:hypothetical protein
MAFLRPYFDYDGFLSYSHGVVPGVPDAPLRDWTLQLISNLESDIQLVDTEFEGLNIWCDKKIDPTVKLTDELRTKVTRSGILLIVMSPRYLTSAWCKDERGWFEQQVEDRMRDQGRVFVIRAMLTDETTWPDFLRDSRGHALPGFQFHATQEALPYCWRGGGADRDLYLQQLRRLQTAVMARLRELRDNANHRAKIETPQPAAPAAGPRRTFLYARPEYAAACDEVKRLLSQDGLPAISAVADRGRDIADFARERRERITVAKQCDALALVRGDGDERFIDDLMEIGVAERERIESARGAPMPCAVLDRSGHGMPIDVSGFGIERFDLGAEDWRGKFHVWLDHSPSRPATAI